MFPSHLPPDVSDVQALTDRIVRLHYADATWAEVDLLPLLRGPLYEQIVHDDVMFRQVFVDPQTGTIAWPNGADVAPEILREAAELSLRRVVAP